ncbi:MAG: hypothetical protein HKO01_02205, partial [Flaviramulus sp.]
YVSVLFLTLYVAVNVSAAVEQLIKEPSYRPKIHVPWYISILGAVAAMVVMWLINPLAFVFALGLEALILIYLISKKLEQQWGDAATGIWMHVGRYALLRLNSKNKHSRNWRPIIILFVHELKEQIALIKLMEMLGQNSGLLTISKLVTFEDKEDLKKRNTIAFEMQKELAKEGLEALTEVNVVNDIKQGILQVSASHGIAGIKTNTVVFGWSRTLEGKIQELEIANKIAASGKNVLIAHAKKPFTERPDKRIDIWWRGEDRNGDLMLLLAYLIRLNNKWKKAVIHIFSVAESEKEKHVLEALIQYSINEGRFDAEIHVIIKDNEDIVGTLINNSKTADIVFCGLARGNGSYEKRTEIMERIVNSLKVVVFTQNNGMQNDIPVIFSLAKE